jgi:hypothetical protein
VWDAPSERLDWRPCGPRDGVPNEWEGTGLPGRDGKARSYRVEAVPLSAGPNRGRVRVKVLYRDRAGGGWRVRGHGKVSARGQ